MDARVTKEFPGLPDNGEQVRMIKVGETIRGELAKVAVREKWAEEIRGGHPSAAPMGGDDNKTDLEKLTVEKLKELAEEKKIDLGDATLKADIIATIEKALAAE